MLGMSRLPYDFAFAEVKTVSQKAMDGDKSAALVLLHICAHGRTEAMATRNETGG